MSYLIILVNVFSYIPHSILNAPPFDIWLGSAYSCPISQIYAGLEPMRGQEITFFERQRIEYYLRGNISRRQMGDYLKRDHSVIVREINRNKDPDGMYRAETAQRKVDLRKRRRHKKKLEIDEDLKLYVIEELQEELSPEQIAGKLKNRLEPRMIDRYVCHETIYQFLYEGQGRFMGLYQYLRRKHKKRQRRYYRKYRQKQPISHITPISFRPEEVNLKQEIGHWESDTTICENKGSALSVQYERKTQLAKLTKVPDKGAEATEGALRELVETMPQGFVKSITLDRGGEGANHWKLRLDYNIDTFHCDPYKSYQKGGVENLNGLIRQYLPRGTNLNNITDLQIYEIQEKLNNRPRKSLKYKTPNEVYRELIGGNVVH